MDVNNKKALHIAMLPWAAFGHMTPFLHLAKFLVEKGHSVSFIATPKNIKRLPNITNQIRFVEFKLPSTPGLPLGAEATSDLSYTHFPYLKVAFDGLQPQLSTFLESSSPHWLIIDFVPYWAVPIASKLGVRTAYFSIFSASTVVFFGPFSTLDGYEEDCDLVGPPDTRTSIQDWTVKPKWVPFESDMALRYFEVVKLSDCLGENVSGVTDVQRLSAILRNCDVIATKSSYEIEPEWLRLLEDICRKRVVPVGHLAPAVDEAPTNSWKPVREWLDKWPQGSVVYVAFGSESTLSREELTALALGLELSEFPFFWALKAQVDELPKGFQERTYERGVIWTSWAPQLRILSHDSVGGFLCHSGWCSVTEAIMLRKPLILFPLFADQGLMTRLLTGKRLGYAIPRDERDGACTKNSVADSLRMVVTEEEGKVYRENAKEMSGVFGDITRQHHYVDEFANYLQTHSA